MANARIRLIQPTVELHDAFLECAFEFGSGHRDGFATDSLTDEDLKDRATFAAWIATRLSYADETTLLPPDRVHDTLSWIVDEREPQRILGSISLRHRLNDFLLQVGGHIGYGVRPSARRKGVATAALTLALDQAKALGLRQALITCQDDNTASARTIERNGGALEDIRETPDHGTVRRYWVQLN
ncbi:acetyltransferase [Flexivirga endophytica]|uniref:Acetyltransferase n=1 Tax=Flexivirga endophytica TaxID=1849103 RepID=A0A916TJM9_9MICO|nr:GNAT family N-acetyltransferase [Flexivirga endophytica]GGB47327.1 acetyltransferase [Flexivirga endophytica]GHB67216.1 acetyltransferase [Flexivirga endophytica]